MDFGKYINDLLQEYEMVIIPGFGAFMSEYKPAEINDETKEIKPPSRVISFQTRIRNNDGLLVGYLAEQKKISHFDALKKIEKERDNILYKLDGGEEYTIKGLGTLHYSHDGNLNFVPLSEEHHTLDSFGLEATSIAVEQVTEKKDEALAHDKEIEHDQKIDDAEASTSDTEEYENISADVEQEKVNEAAGMVNAEVANIETKAYQATDPNDIKDKSEEQENKKRRGWWLLLLVLVPLIGISVFAFFRKEKSNGSESSDEIRITEVEQTEKAQNKPETIDSTATAEKDTAVSEDSSLFETPDVNAEINSKVSFYLIGGSFKEQENAETYLNELKAKGFDPFHLGKYGSYHVVGIGTYNTEQEASSAKEKYLLENPGSGVWILER